MSSDVGHGVRSASTTVTRSGRTGDIDHLPVGAVFDVLSDERRRHLLYYLIEDAGGAASATEIADRLGSVEPDVASPGREAVLVALHHRHLPRLEEAGLVEYDGRGGTVRYLEDPLVEEFLARVAVRDFGGRS